MLNNEEIPRGVPPQPGRRPAPTRQDSRFSSPSTTYNYNSNAGYNQGSGFGGQQHPRRRIDRFKRESINYNDRMIRQNDSIIRLLKEIRDRLPAPPLSAVGANDQEQAVQEGTFGAAASDNSESATEGMDGLDQVPETDQEFEGQAEHDLE